MLAKRTSFNPKRRIASAPVQADLDRLKPPLGPRPGKTLCDLAGIFNRAVAQQLLRKGIRSGLVSQQGGAGYPQNVWAVSAQGVPLEAQLENAGDASYHGYPMPEDDAFREKVLEKWKAAHD